MHSNGMNVWPILYILLITLLQTLALFLPLVAPLFVGAGYSAGIFTVSLISGHLAIFWPRLKPWHLMALLPVMLVSEYLALTFYINYSRELFPGLYEGSFARGFQLLELGYSGLYRSLFIQFLISLMIAIGLWVGRKHSLLKIRRTAYDEEEQMNLFEFRQQFDRDEETTLFRYRKLINRGLSLVGVRKHRILGCLQSLRIDDMLCLYDLYITEEGRDEKLDILMVRDIINRPEITTSSIDTVVALVREGREDQAEFYKSIGFVPFEADDPATIERLRKELDSLFAEMFPDWKPFSNIGHFLRISLALQKERDQGK